MKTISTAFLVVALCSGAAASGLRGTRQLAASNSGCLCVFDVDRTVTAYCGASDCSSAIPGSSAIAGVADASYGCGFDTIIAPSAAATVAWCRTQGCGVGVATDSSKDFNGKLSSTAGKAAFADVFGASFDFDACSEANSLCQTVENGGTKGDKIKNIMAGMETAPSTVYFFDDGASKRSDACAADLGKDVTLYASNPSLSAYDAGCSDVIQPGLEGDEAGGDAPWERLASCE